MDKNPDAIIYVKKNIEINKIKTVHPVLGDSRELVPRFPRPDRIIMNLPHSAVEFLDVALRHVKPKGTIHLYAVMESDSQEVIRRSITRLALSLGRGISFSKVREVHTYSPSQSVFCLDLLVG